MLTCCGRRAYHHGMRTPQRCEMCDKGPARVFKPTIALCGPCAREADEMEKLDNACANEPYCPVDGSLLNDRGRCLECYERALHVFVNGMVSVG